MAPRKFQTTTTSPIRGRSKGSGARITALARVHTEGENGDQVEWFLLEERNVTLGREPGVDRIALDDPEASRRHAELEWVRESAVYRIRDLKSRNRTYLDGRAIESDYLQHGSVIRIGGTLLVYSELTLSEGLPPFAPEPGNSLLRQQAERMADVAAPSGLPILILGPTGAGKELLARRVHEKSGRKGPLVAVNCSTFSRELIGSELFGHVAGAFSGAQGNRAGLFSAANGGTLFLDEIAELPLEQQPALLRVLQEGKIRPVGADRETPVDVRVVAATHQQLDDAVARNTFRSDLFARLAGFRVELAGLSRRREEIVALFRAFIGQNAPPLSSEAVEALLLYSWPQNVRELKHAAERVKLLARGGDTIPAGALPAEVRSGAQETAPALEEEAPTKEQLEKLLGEHNGNVAQVARALGKHRQQLYRWLKKYELTPENFRSELE